MLSLYISYGFLLYLLFPRSILYGGDVITRSIDLSCNSGIIFLELYNGSRKPRRSPIGLREGLAPRMN